MNRTILAGALGVLAIPSMASAAPEAKPAPDTHHEGMKHDGCCPEKKDGEPQKDDCCKGMKCCDKMKAAEKATPTPDAHAGHQMNH